MAISKALEMYVKTIHKLQTESEDEEAITVTEISDQMEVKPPSVTDAIQRLDKLGMVDYKRYRGVKLTKKGMKVAEELACRFDTLKEFLILIGVDDKIATEDACEIEHMAHPKTVQHLMKFVEFVQSTPEKPKWLDQFQEFLKTGKHS